MRVFDGFDSTETSVTEETSTADLLDTFRFHRPLWDRWIYYILPAAAVIQWILVIPLAVRNDVLTGTSSGFDPLRGSLQQGVSPTGFFNDFFFIVWNLFPIVLWGRYMAGLFIGRGRLSDLNDRVSLDEGAQSIQRLVRIRDHWIPTLAIFAFGVFSMAAQVPKQLGFFASGSQLYWWDWRVSPEIFIIRDVALFFNTVLVVFVFWSTFFALLILLQTVRKGTLRPQFFHPDSACGFLPLGQLLSVLILPWVAGAFLGVMGWLDHTTASELLFRIGDLTLILVATVTATTTFFLPSWYVRQAIQEDVDAVQEKMANLTNPDQLSEDFRHSDVNQFADIDPTEHEITDSASILLLYQRLDGIDGWPFNKTLLLQVVLTIASPLLTILTQSINTFINTYWF